MQAFAPHGHFLIVHSLNTYTLVLLSQVLSDDGLHCSQLLCVSAMECPETSMDKSDHFVSFITIINQHEINTIIVVI